MTDQAMSPQLPPQPPVPPAKDRGGKGVRIALAVSVALNLAILGLVAGAALHGGGMGFGHGGVRELGFGPFSEALDHDQRAALRRAFFEKAPDFRATRQAMRADRDALLAALRAQPFDPATVDAVMAAQAKRMEGQLQLGQGLIRDLLVSMPEADRLAFADRLQDRLDHGPEDGGP